MVKLPTEEGSLPTEEDPPTNPTERSLRNPPARLSSDEDEDWDDDISEPDEDLTSLATDDTQVVVDLNIQGMALYEDNRCLLELSQRVKGHALLCGHPRENCPRRKHRELVQTAEDHRGRPGYCQQLPNAKGTTADAVSDTFMTTQAWIERRQSNRTMLTQLGQTQSAAKQRLEEQLKPKSAPVVRIDTTPQGPRAQQITAWTKSLPVTPQARRPITSPTPLGQVTGATLTGALIPGQTPSTAHPAEPPTPTSRGPFRLNVATTPVKATGPPGQRTAVPVPPVSASGPMAAPQPAPMVPSAVPPVPMQATGDPMLVALLTKLVDKVDALNASHQTVMQSNGQMMTQLANQTVQLGKQQDEIERLRTQGPTIGTQGQPGQVTSPLPATVSIPTVSEGAHKKLYAVARGRRVGVFTNWKETEKSVHG
jgi:hypothetical protein